MGGRRVRGLFEGAQRSKKLLLLPGQHSIVVRQDGYKDFARQVTVQPGEEQLVRVAMERDAQPLPPVTATVKISANPDRAAVFMDGLFVGHVGEFNRGSRALLIPPGTHRIRIALPGYESFEADIDPAPDQKVEIKTDLLRSRDPIRRRIAGTGRDRAPAGESGGNLPGAMASPAGK